MIDALLDMLGRWALRAQAKAAAIRQQTEVEVAEIRRRAAERVEKIRGSR